jgi:hypothetical protein
MRMLPRTTTQGGLLSNGVRLFGSALALCVILFASFWFAQEHKLNLAWSFFGWSSILFIAAVGRGFRGQYRNPLFLAFFAIWTVVHGAFSVLLIGWVPMVYWLPAFGLELFLGYLVAYRLFGLPRDAKQ